MDIQPQRGGMQPLQPLQNLYFGMSRTKVKFGQYQSMPWNHKVVPGFSAFFILQADTGKHAPNHRSISSWIDTIREQAISFWTLKQVSRFPESFNSFIQGTLWQIWSPISVQRRSLDFFFRGFFNPTKESFDILQQLGCNTSWDIILLWKIIVEICWDAVFIYFHWQERHQNTSKIIKGLSYFSIRWGRDVDGTEGDLCKVLAWTRHKWLRSSVEAVAEPWAEPGRCMDWNAIGVWNGLDCTNRTVTEMMMESTGHVQVVWWLGCKIYEDSHGDNVMVGLWYVQVVGKSRTAVWFLADVANQSTQQIGKPNSAGEAPTVPTSLPWHQTILWIVFGLPSHWYFKKSQIQPTHDPFTYTSWSSYVKLSIQPQTVIICYPFWIFWFFSWGTPNLTHTLRKQTVSCPRAPLVFFHLVDEIASS